jgi:hypothetical protein
MGFSMSFMCEWLKLFERLTRLLKISEFESFKSIERLTGHKRILENQLKSYRFELSKHFERLKMSWL